MHNRIFIAAIAVFCAASIFTNANAVANEEQVKDGSVLSCRLVSVSVYGNADVSVYQREEFEQQDCPANFMATDSDGNNVKLTALVRAIPNVPRSTKCGTTLEALIQYDIDTAGRTTDVFALSGAPRKWVRRSIKAVKKMRFEPYLVDGHATALSTLNISFKGLIDC